MNAGYPANLFSDKTRYLSVIRAGISGSLVQETVKTIQHQIYVICRACNFSFLVCGFSLYYTNCTK